MDKTMNDLYKLNQSIFHQYYKMPEILYDRKIERDEEGIDVIIPTINTNELFKRNLFNFYKTIPINNLIIGDGGCTDDTIEVATKFPRAKIIDQSKYVSQGYAIKELIEKVTTKYFIYLHADVFLPDNWYDEMFKYREKYDWFECYRKMTVLVMYDEEYENNAERAFSGSQFGRKDAFTKFLDQIDDDYLQRNEDIIFHNLVEYNGGKYARINDTFHYHQVMNRRGEKEPKFKKVSIEKETDKKWQKKIFTMQAKGIIKYLNPDKKYLIDNVNSSIRYLYKHTDDFDWFDFKNWVNETNPKWNKVIRKESAFKQKMIKIAKQLYGKLNS